MGSGSCGVLCKGRPVMRDLEAYKQPPRGSSAAMRSYGDFDEANCY